VANADEVANVSKIAPRRIGFLRLGFTFFWGNDGAWELGSMVMKNCVMSGQSIKGFFNRELTRMKMGFGIKLLVLKIEF
jgi:hypothetical protein